MVWSYFDVWKDAWWKDSFPRIKLWTFILIPVGTAFLLGFKLLVPRTPLNKSAMGRNICVIMIIASFLSPVGFTLFRPIKVMHVDSYPGTHLYSFYLACKSYWEEKGNDKNCDLNIASQKEYGFIKSREISISGKGKAANFTAAGYIEKIGKVFTIDAEGKITEAESR